MNTNKDIIYQDLSINTNPLVSVHIITYNQEKYIRKTIESVISQRVSFKYELIIGDDHSTDGTLKICLEYYRKYPNIVRVVANDSNKGLLRNFHETVALSRGKYISGVAGDDWWHNINKLQKQVDFLENNTDYGMVFGQTILYSEEKGMEYSVSKSKRDCTFGQLMMANFVIAPTTCYKKSLFDQYIQEINPIDRQFVCEDYPMWLWLSYNTKFFRIDEPLATYRVLDNSLSHFTSPKKALRFEKKVMEIRLYMYYYLKVENEKLLHDIYFIYYYNNMYLASLVNNDKLECEREAFFRKNHHLVSLLLSHLFKRYAKCPKLLNCLKKIQYRLSKRYVNHCLRCEKYY